MNTMELHLSPGSIKIGNNNNTSNNNNNFTTTTTTSTISSTTTTTSITITSITANNNNNNYISTDYRTATWQDPSQASNQQRRTRFPSGFIWSTI